MLFNLFFLYFLIRCSLEIRAVQKTTKIHNYTHCFNLTGIFF